MTRPKPAHEIALEAMIRDYEASCGLESGAKVTWTKTEIGEAVGHWFDEEWDSTKLANTIQTLRYRNLIEAVGDAPPTPGRGGNTAKLWCPIRVMEMETEPRKKPIEEMIREAEVDKPMTADPITPEELGALKPGDQIVGKVKTDDNGKPVSISLLSVNSFKPVTYESAAPVDMPVEIAPETVAQPDHDFAEDETVHPVSVPVIPVQQGKSRKRKNHEPEMTPDQEMLHTVRQLAGSLKDIQQQLSTLNRGQRETRDVANRVADAFHHLDDEFDDFGNFARSIEEWIKSSGDKNRAEVAAFKSGFVQGWNECVKTRGAIPLTDGNVSVTLTNDEREGDLDTSNVRVIRDPDPTDEDADYSDEVKAASKRVERLLKTGNREFAIEVADEMARNLMRECDEFVRSGKYIDKYNGKVVGLPDWGMRMWRRVLKTLGEQTGSWASGKRALELCTETVTVYRTSEHVAKFTCHMIPDSEQNRADIDFLVVQSRDFSKMKAVPYTMLVREKDSPFGVGVPFFDFTAKS